MAKLKTFKRRVDLKLAKSQFRKYYFDCNPTHTHTHTRTQTHTRTTRKHSLPLIKI